MPVIRQPPSIETMAQHLTAQLAKNGARHNIDTIPASRGPCPSCPVRRDRLLKHCHTPCAPKARHPSPRDSGAYVPELAARLDNDRNLTDGARRCARKLAQYIYQRNRDGREGRISGRKVVGGWFPNFVVAGDYTFNPLANWVNARLIPV